MNNNTEQEYGGKNSCICSRSRGNCQSSFQIQENRKAILANLISQFRSISGRSQGVSSYNPWGFQISKCMPQLKS